MFRRWVGADGVYVTNEYLSELNENEIEILKDRKDILWIFSGEGPREKFFRDKLIGYKNCIMTKLHPADKLPYWINFADIHLIAANHLISNGNSNLFNCGYGRGYSVKEIVQNLNNILGKEIKVEIGNRREGDSKMIVSDVSKFK